MIEHIDNYSQTSGILWQFCRDEPTINAADGAIADFTEANAITDLFKVKENSRSNRQQWHKKCWNNGTIKICK